MIFAQRDRCGRVEMAVREENLVPFVIFESVVFYYSNLENAAPVVDACLASALCHIKPMAHGFF